MTTLQTPGDLGEHNQKRHRNLKERGIDEGGMKGVAEFFMKPKPGGSLQ
jgi:hypothetical protein